MEPKKIVRLRKVVYFDCGSPGHNHKTKRVAQNCIDKKKRKAESKPQITWTKEMYAAILDEHRNVASQRDLARKLSLSPERVRQVLSKAARLEREPQVQDDPFCKLDTRIRHHLFAEGLNTVESVLLALQAGSIDSVPGLGKLSKTKIRRWLNGIVPSIPEVLP